MMRLLMFVCLAGAAAYAVIPTNSEPEWNSGATLATAEPETNPQGERQLRSWGPTLKSLGREPEPRPAASPQRDAPPSREEAVYWQGDAGANQASQRTTNVAAAAKAEGPTEALVTTAEHVAWARVILAAKAHSEASVSSPITKFYPIGTELQIVGRESGWLELLDPVTQERGFVFEKYLVAIDGPSPTQSVTQARATPPPANVAAKVASPKAQTPRQAAKPVQQASNDVEATPPDELAGSDRKRDRLVKKEERRERKLFRLFGGREPAPWTVGAPR